MRKEPDEDHYFGYSNQRKFSEKKTLKQDFNDIK